MKDFLFKTTLFTVSSIAISIVLFVTGYVFFESAAFFTEISCMDFITGTEWDPISGIHFAILPAILGTIVVSILAVCISLPLAFGCSISFCYYLKGNRKYIAGICIDVIAGIPSVVVGFAGMLTLVPFLEERLDMAAGESVLAAGIVLAFMLLPFELSFLIEHIERLRIRYEAAALSLGFDTFSALTALIVPGMKCPLFTAGMLAFARGMGETMAVMMVIGNSNLLPRLLGKSVTIPSRIALEMGMAEAGSLHYQALFAAAFILIVMVFILNSIARIIMHRRSIP